MLSVQSKAQGNSLLAGGAQSRDLGAALPRHILGLLATPFLVAMLLPIVAATSLHAGSPKSQRTTVLNATIQYSHWDRLNDVNTIPVS